MFSWIPTLLSLLIQTVMGVETIHADASTETRTQIAQQSLALAGNDLATAFPSHATNIQAAAASVSGSIPTIQAAVKQANAAKLAAAALAGTKAAIAIDQAVQQPAAPASVQEAAASTIEGITS